MELDEIKTAWKDMNNRLEQMEKINKRMVNDLLDSRQKSAMSKLMKYEVFFLVFTLVYAGLTLLPLIWKLFPLQSVIIFECIFILAAAWQAYKIYLLREMDVSRCTTSELIKKAVRFKVITRMRTIVGMILLGPVLVLIYFSFQNIMNTPMLVGMVVGAVIGLMVGLFLFFKNLKDIDSLIKSYKDIDELEK